MPIDNVYTYSAAHPSDISQMRFYGLKMSNLQVTEEWLKTQAAFTGKTYYYQQLSELQRVKEEVAACRKEILEKYPYDGKSTFKELLAKAVKGE